MSQYSLIFFLLSVFFAYIIGPSGLGSSAWASLTSCSFSPVSSAVTLHLCSFLHSLSVPYRTSNFFPHMGQCQVIFVPPFLLTSYSALFFLARTPRHKEKSFAPFSSIGTLCRFFFPARPFPRSPRSLFSASRYACQRKSLSPVNTGADSLSAICFLLYYSFFSLYPYVIA